MKTDSVLAQTFRAALAIWDQQKADGVSEADRLAQLEGTLRQAWPFTREWKYLCRDCQDHGLVLSSCPGDASCGRHRPHLAHEFGTPCWCEAGRKFRAKPKAAEDFTQAAKVSKPTRLGR